MRVVWVGQARSCNHIQHQDYSAQRRVSKGGHESAFKHPSDFLSSFHLPESKSDPNNGFPGAERCGWTGKKLSQVDAVRVLNAVADRQLLRPKHSGVLGLEGLATSTQAWHARVEMVQSIENRTVVYMNRPVTQITCVVMFSNPRWLALLR